MNEILNVRLSDDTTYLVILDQTQLPNRVEYKKISSLEECYQAIKNLEVRGAPCIGIFAGYAMYIISKKYCNLSYHEFKVQFYKDAEYLNSSRPTAVNLSWALSRMCAIVEKKDRNPLEICLELKEEAIKIENEDNEMCRKISENGLSLVKDGAGILTHCNAGPLATNRYGTALGPILLGKSRGMDFHVFADETRPLLQGARLTAFELMNAEVDVTLICDNMASLVMKNGWVDACFVGCDRIAANGDFANKIGTSNVAILAKYYGIPFYTLGPTSTIDINCPDGSYIPIELRDPDEIKNKWYYEPMSPSNIKCYNPAFDITNHELITGIITEKGICYPPFEKSLKQLFE